MSLVILAVLIVGLSAELIHQYLADVFRAGRGDQ